MTNTIKIKVFPMHSDSEGTFYLIEYYTLEMSHSNFIKCPDIDVAGRVFKDILNSYSMSTVNRFSSEQGNHMTFVKKDSAAM
jgi:hypothetical protein